MSLTSGNCSIQNHAPLRIDCGFPLQVYDKLLSYEPQFAFVPLYEHEQPLRTAALKMIRSIDDLPVK